MVTYGLVISHHNQTTESVENVDGPVLPRIGEKYELEGNVYTVSDVLHKAHAERTTGKLELTTNMQPLVMITYRSGHEV
ncbi:MAG: hypothetical protein WC796_05885 [Candidatus Pacearchaeota archaeon]|jgi:hypothetical protein